jgi:Zn finger protein HypA/HybF involved in hydrogenase expression
MKQLKRRVACEHHITLPMNAKHWAQLCPKCKKHWLKVLSHLGYRYYNSRTGLGMKLARA